MRKYLALILLFSAIGTFAEGLPNHKWGTQKEHLLKDTPGKKIDDNVYLTKVLDWECETSYQFEKNKLVNASYSVTKLYNSGKELLTDYEKAKKHFTKFYGSLPKEEIEWVDSTKANLLSLEEALFTDYVTIKTEWVTEDTVIKILLFHFDSKIYFTFVYSSKEYLSRYNL